MLGQNIKSRKKTVHPSLHFAPVMDSDLPNHDIYSNTSGSDSEAVLLNKMKAHLKQKVEENKICKIKVKKEA